MEKVGINLHPAVGKQLTGVWAGIGKRTQKTTKSKSTRNTKDTTKPTNKKIAVLQETCLPNLCLFLFGVFVFFVFFGFV